MSVTHENVETVATASYHHTEPGFLDHLSLLSIVTDSDKNTRIIAIESVDVMQVQRRQCVGLPGRKVPAVNQRKSHFTDYRSHLNALPGFKGRSTGTNQQAQLGNVRLLHNFHRLHCVNGNAIAIQKRSQITCGQSQPLSCVLLKSTDGSLICKSV